MGQSKAALPCCSHWVLHIVVRTCIVVQPYALLLGSTCHRWALRVVVGPYASPLGSMLRRLTLLIAVVPYASWLGSMHCHWALLVAIGLGTLSWGPLPHRLPLRLIVCV